MSGLVTSAVLKNPVVSFKLKEVIVYNVTSNPDVQFMVHEVLLNQILTPNKVTIKQLITNSITSIPKNQ